ncbi:SRPBCC family protein [Streptomyces sp. NPDC050610]|uniref:SRPBCC family protein n=1 Tax=Streptomyces sp. NPDC050610 TaxID=3157097 RepID=UPI0034490A3F
MAGKLEFVYVTYIQSTPEKLWKALTDPEQTAVYWGHSNVSDWQVGSAWEHQRTDGTGTADVVGRVVVNAEPTRLVTTWAEPGGGREAEPSRVTFDIEPYGEIVRLTVTHVDLADEAERDATGGGWAAVLSNLKTFIETGRPLPQEPWTMP